MTLKQYEFENNLSDWVQMQSLNKSTKSIIYGMHKWTKISCTKMKKGQRFLCFFLVVSQGDQIKRNWPKDYNESTFSFEETPQNNIVNVK